MPAGMAAAMASVEYQVRNIRSVKLITVQETMEVTNGRARRTTSRPPQGRVHQLPSPRRRGSASRSSCCKARLFRVIMTGLGILA